jgi:hypothetical protein
MVKTQHQTEFTKLLLASFLSQSGSYFLTIALAGFVFFRSGSIIKASLVFTLSYLPAILIGGRVGNWIDRYLSRWLLVRNELVSIVTSFLCGVCIMFEVPLVILCMLLALRSVFLFTARTAGIKWIKLITPSELQAMRVRLFYLSFFLATSAAGILAATALAHPSVVIVILIDVGTYVLSTSVLLTLRQLPPVENAAPASVESFNTITSVREILSWPALSPYFISVCLSQSVFQGAYTILVSYLPGNRFQLGIRGLGPFQVAASLGIIVGFFALGLFLNSSAKKSPAPPVVLLTALGVVSLLTCVAVPNLPSSLFSFFLFNAAYECIWLHSVSEFVKHSPQRTLARYQFVMSSSASCSMAIFSLSYAVSIELVGLQTGVTVVMSTGLFLWCYASRRNALRRQLFGT